MNINFKTKLYAGLGILVFLIVILWGSGFIFINTLSENSSAIIRNNNRTIFYMQNMEQALTRLHLFTNKRLTEEQPHLTEQEIDSLKDRLYENLNNQIENITEEGENKLSSSLQAKLLLYLDQFERFRGEASSDPELYRSMANNYGEIQHLLARITYMNLDAIEQKNARAQQTASNVSLYMAIIGALSTLFALALLMKYPNYIVNPINELIERVKKIADQNYDQRLEFETGDEYEELATAFNTMASRLQEYDSTNLAKLKNEKQRIEAIINQMNEAVIGLDNNRHILFVNNKAMELIGIPREQLVGRYAPDVTVKSDLVGKLIKNLMKEEGGDGNQNDEPDLIKIKSNNRQVYYSRETLPVFMGDENEKGEKQIGFIITLKNVTQFQEMSEAKSNFIAVVSHELKTPIASINMSLRLLQDERIGSLNKEQVELLDSIKKEARRMKQTTAELLDLSKIETGNIQLNSQSARPLNLLEYAYETMVMQANQKNLDLEIECDKDLPLVRVDLQKSVWVLVNLLSNAIRYTPTLGTIKMKAEDKPRTIQFSVIDNGKGIPDEYRDKIFQKYFQIHSDKNDRGGSGLGLAIAKEFINAQGGEIFVESELGEGSTFYFTLPKVKSIEQDENYET